MRKFLFIFALVFACTALNAFADDFYVIPSPKPNYAPVEKTGQIVPFYVGDDGVLRKGVAWPNPRFTDNSNGTVTDNLTGLVWKKYATLSIASTWYEALNICNALAAGPDTGLSDGSVAGDWRLPNIKELLGLIDYGPSYQALPANHPFKEVDPAPYWSSTTMSNLSDNSKAWTMGFDMGIADSNDKSGTCAVWPVRDRK